jgi:hypothetical protein
VSENLQKLVGVAVMALIVVVGVVATNDDDTDFTRNRALRDRDAATSSAAPDRSSEADDRSTYVFDYDDEDSSGNESERVTFALELDDEAESGGGASECCDLNAFEIQLLKERIQELESELAEWAGKSGDSVAAIQKELSGLSSALEDHLADKSVGSKPEYSADVQQIADEVTEFCPIQSEDSFWQALSQGECIRQYLIGFPLEVARQVVFTHGRFASFHRFNYDLGNKPKYNAFSKYGLVTPEACGPINYGYHPPPRMAIGLDTHQGLVVPKNYKLGSINTGGWEVYFQDIEVLGELWSLVSVAPSMIPKLHWPTVVEENQSYADC